MIFLSADTKNINIGGNNDEYGYRRHDKKAADRQEHDAG